MKYLFYINETIKEYPYSLVTLRSDVPNVSFPKNIPESTLAEYNVFPVTEVSPPEHNPVMQKLVEEFPVLQSDTWHQVWSVQDRTPEEIMQVQQAIVADVTNGVQQRLDEFAQTKNYDNIMSACTYATSTIPTFQQEGQRAVQLRDMTWAACYQIMEDAQQGIISMPLKYEDIEPMLPELTWEEVNGSN